MKTEIGFVNGFKQLLSLPWESWSIIVFTVCVVLLLPGFISWIREATSSTTTFEIVGDAGSGIIHMARADVPNQIKSGTRMRILSADADLTLQLYVRSQQHLEKGEVRVPVEVKEQLVSNTNSSSTALASFDAKITPAQSHGIFGLWNHHNNDLKWGFRFLFFGFVLSAAWDYVLFRFVGP
ncbi:MAG: hypothetical protein AAF224_13685 [Pseudomonadota bacterium]